MLLSANTQMLLDQAVKNRGCANFIDSMHRFFFLKKMFHKHLKTLLTVFIYFYSFKVVVIDKELHESCISHNFLYKSITCMICLVVGLCAFTLYFNLG